MIEKHWFVKTSNKTVGPVSSEQLCKWIADGTVLRTTMVRSNESEKFIPADKIKGLFEPDSVVLDEGVTDRQSVASQVPVSQVQSRNKLPTTAYLATASVVLATGAIGIWLMLASFGNSKKDNRDVAASASREIANLNSLSNPQQKNTLAEASQAPKITSVPTKPQGLPEFLPPLPIPDLRSMSDLSKETDSTLELPQRPETKLEFPRKFSGVYHGALGGTAGKGFAGLEIEFDKFIPTAPPHRYVSPNQRKRERNNRERISKNGAMGIANYFVEKLPDAYSDFAVQTEGTIRVFKIGNPSIGKNEKGYLHVPQKEIDSCRFTGWVDPHHRVMSISTKKWKIGKDYFIRNVVPQVSLSGYWIPERRVVSGWAGYHSHHFCVSDDQKLATELIAQAVAVNQSPSRDESNAWSAYSKTLRRPLPSSKDSQSVRRNWDYQKPSKAKTQLIKDSKALIQWAQPLLVQLDDGRQWHSDDEYFDVFWLFSSEHFEKHFGKPFEQLAYVERRRLTTMRQHLSQQNREQKNKSLGKAVSGIDRLLRYAASDLWYSQTISFITNQRWKRIWVDDSLKQLKELDSYEGCFEDYEYTEPWRILGLLGRLQIDKQTPEQLFAVSRVERAIAELDGWTVPLRLTENQRRYDLLLSSLDEKQRQRYRDKSAGLAEDYLKKDFLTYFDQLVAVKDNLAGISVIKNWLTKFDRAFDKLQHLKAHNVAYQYAAKRHQRLVKTYLPQLMYELDTATNEDAVKRIQFSATGYSVNRNSEEGLALNDAITRNLTKLAHEQNLRFFSEQERSWMSGDSLVINVPEVIPEPTAESIKRAFYREVVRLPACSWETPDKIKYSIPPMDRFGVFAKLKILDMTKVANPDGRTAISESDGFRCFYRFNPKITMPKMGDANDPRQRFLEGLSQVTSESASLKTNSDVFVLTREGWRSPTIRSRGIESIGKFFQSLGGG